MESYGCVVKQVLAFVLQLGPQVGDQVVLAGELFVKLKVVNEVSWPQAG